MWKQQQNRLMSNADFIGLHTSSVNNSQRCNDYSFIHRFSSVVRKSAIVMAQWATNLSVFIESMKTTMTNTQSILKLHRFSSRRQKLQPQRRIKEYYSSFFINCNVILNWMPHCSTIVTQMSCILNELHRDSYNLPKYDYYLIARTAIQKIVTELNDQF